MRQDSDDSYEAAMRAADALFARPQAQPAEPSGAATEQPSAATDDAAASPASPERGGRILRVLNEPPPPQLVALEAAHAPKRRGRKPGSKNKPKPPFAQGVTFPAAAGVPGSSPAEPVPSFDTAAGATHEPPQVIAASATPRLAAIPAADAPPQNAPAHEAPRFPWVRDRLKPGEAWKRRRLPRICW